MGMNTANGRFSEAMRIKANDTDPAQINVQDKKYILGNTTINLFNDEIRTTLLEITNINNDATVVANYNITKISIGVKNNKTKKAIKKSIRNLRNLEYNIKGIFYRLNSFQKANLILQIYKTNLKLLYPLLIFGLHLYIILSGIL